MIAIIVIAFIALVVYLLFFKKEDDVELEQCAPMRDAETPKEVIEEEPIITDEFGKKYRNVKMSREIPRKTFLLGRLQGKYWGELDEEKEQEFLHDKFYNFNIYEADVFTAEHDSLPFPFVPDARFPKGRLPHLLPVNLSKDGKDYSLNIHEPQLSNIKFDQRLHQTEGSEIFGTIDADITGYVLDFITEEYIEREYLAEIKPVSAAQKQNKDVKTYHPTGNVEYNGNYRRTEYYFSNYRDKYWGNWVYIKPIRTTQEEGCLSSGIGLLGGVLGFAFLIILIPNIAILLPFILLPIVLKFIPEKAWTWIFRIIGGLLFFAFIFSILHLFQQSSTSYVPKPIVQDKPEERRTQYEPIRDTLNEEVSPDTLISHYRSWQDYNGNSYEGSVWVKKSDYNNARNYKSNLSFLESTENNYDKIVFSLKEFDKQNLQGVFQLFDSLRSKRKLAPKIFAEAIVSFAQDIPYAVVLPEGCDPNLYADDFIKEYLSSEGAKCDGYEKFGINTPIEFMASLQGDCDTRTLFLYTILAHYGYDVVMMSSEYYNHSLIGINLPYEGIAYKYGNQRYVLWETTAPNFKPGMLAKEISNIDYWRISLKSK